MMRALLCLTALLGLAAVGLAADTKDAKDAKTDNGTTATVTRMDAKKNTITLQWKDKNGKDEQQTFNITNDVRLMDENGKAFAADALKEGDDVRFTERDGKLVEIDREKAGTTAGTGNKAGEEEATITKVDAKNGTVTVQMKDKDGKEVQRTFTLTEDARYFDSTGKVAALDVFRSGNDVLVVEEQGKLKQLKQKPAEKKEPGK